MKIEEKASMNRETCTTGEKDQAHSNRISANLIICSHPTQ